MWYSYDVHVMFICYSMLFIRYSYGLGFWLLTPKHMKHGLSSMSGQSCGLFWLFEIPEVYDIREDIQRWFYQVLPSNDKKTYFYMASMFINVPINLCVMKLKGKSYSLLGDGPKNLSTNLSFHGKNRRCVEWFTINWIMAVTARMASAWRPHGFPGSFPGLFCNDHALRLAEQWCAACHDSTPGVDDADLRNVVVGF